MFTFLCVVGIIAVGLFVLALIGDIMGDTVLRHPRGYGPPQDLPPFWKMSRPVQTPKPKPRVRIYPKMRRISPPP